MAKIIPACWIGTAMSHTARHQEAGSTALTMGSNECETRRKDSKQKVKGHASTAQGKGANHGGQLSLVWSDARYVICHGTIIGCGSTVNAVPGRLVCAAIERSTSCYNTPEVTNLTSRHAEVQCQTPGHLRALSLVVACRGHSQPGVPAHNTPYTAMTELLHFWTLEDGKLPRRAVIEIIP